MDQMDTAKATTHTIRSSTLGSGSGFHPPQLIIDAHEIMTRRPIHAGREKAKISSPPVLDASEAYESRCCLDSAVSLMHS